MTDHDDLVHKDGQAHCRATSAIGGFQQALNSSIRRTFERTTTSSARASIGTASTAER